MNKYIFLIPEILLYDDNLIDNNLFFTFSTDKNYITDVRGLEYINQEEKKGGTVSFTVLLDNENIKKINNLIINYKKMRLLFHYGDYILDENNKEHTAYVAYCNIKKINNQNNFYNIELDVINNLYITKQERIKNLFNISTSQKTTDKVLNKNTLAQLPSKYLKSITIHTNNDISPQDLNPNLQKTERTQQETPPSVNNKYINICYMVESINSFKVDYLENTNQDFYIFKTSKENVNDYINNLMQLLRIRKHKNTINRPNKILIYNSLLNDFYIYEKHKDEVKKTLFNNIIDTQERGKPTKTVICSVIINTPTQKTYKEIKGFKTFNNLEIKGD